ncbi:MAG: hypothetical protein AAFW95_07540, partial [Cyanobacteria bacterium J06638_6]
MSNNYGAFAAITVDAAGTEHAVWEHQGLLWHTYFDQTANQWGNGSPVSNAAGGSDLQLLTGNLIPYLSGNATAYAPGLVAVWQDDSSDLSYVVGRYTSAGEVEWSDAVDFGQPNLNDPDGTVLSQNPAVTLAPGIDGGVPPSVAVVYEIANSGTDYIANWQGSGGSEDYQVTFRFEGTDQNGDGILSGRGTTSSLGDGVDNELTGWAMEVFAPDGAALVSYDLDDQQTLDAFNFNYDLTSEVVLANDDAGVFDPSTSAYGLNVGLDATTSLTGVSLWNLLSQSASEDIILQQTPAGGSPTQATATELSSAAFQTTTSTVDDTDLYSEFIGFRLDNSGAIVDQNNNQISFNPATQISPNYQSLGPEYQFLTADAVDASSSVSANSADEFDLGTIGVTVSPYTPLGSVQGFFSSLAGLQGTAGGIGIPPPSSVVPSSSGNLSFVLNGAIGASRGKGKDKGDYLLQTSIALGANNYIPVDNPQGSLQTFAKSAQEATNTSASKSAFTEGADFTFTLGVDSRFSPDSNGDLTYASSELTLTLAFGSYYEYKLVLPASPKQLRRSILDGRLDLSYLNFEVDADVTLDAKPDAPLLPIYLEGNIDDPSSIQLVNGTFLKWLGLEADDVDISESVLQILDNILNNYAPRGEGQETSPLLQGVVGIETLVGLVYGAQIIEQAYKLLSNTDDYTFEEADIALKWLPTLEGSLKAVYGALSGSGSGNLEIGFDLSLKEGGEVSAELEASESFKASASTLFWNWSWKEGWNQQTSINLFNVGSAPAPNGRVAANLSLGDDGNTGDVQVIYSAIPGTNTLYRDDGSAVSQSATADTLNDLINDDDVVLASDSISGSVLLAWVAAGSDSSLPLGAQG